MLEVMPSAVEVPAGHYIGGQLIAETAESLPVSRPSDRAPYADLPLGDAQLVDRAVQNARAAFLGSGWATQHPRMRAKAMRKWADLVEADAGRLAAIEAVGSTRPFGLAVKGDVPYVAETIRYYAELADKVGGEVAATQASRLGMMITEPYGVTAAIVPWNFPLIIAAWKLGPALAAGNAIVIKPSELTPFSVVRLAELAVAAGIPAGILNVVQGTGPATGDALVRHPLVSKISFTGSTGAGMAIMATSAQSGLKPVTLELGGKSPQIVFDDADLALAARCIVNAMTYNAGQVCVAGSRLLVHRRVADELLARMSELMQTFAPASTWSADGTYSPIVSERQMGRIDAIVRNTVAQGASVVTGGCAFDSHDGAFYRPTILAGVDGDMDAVQEEIFGPVLTMQTFESEEEALGLAGHPVYGLAAGVYSRDLSRVLRVVRRLEVGTVWVNRYGRSEDLAIPTGGYKQSGIGKDLGRHAFEANMRIKSVLIDIEARP